MECWAHAAARRRQLSDDTLLVVSKSSSISSTSSRKSSSATCASLPSSVSLDASLFTEMIRRTLPQARMPHVCVVGAGMAGLRAADVLTKKGVRVTIFEGRNRVGGRICQSTHLGHLADLGPNWIHGTEGNPILDLAKETQTTYFEPSNDVPTSLYDENGAFVESDTSQEQTGRIWETIEEAYKHSRENGATIPSDQSLLDFFKMRFKAQDIDEVSTKQLLQIARVWGDIVGEPVERQSLKFFWLEECLEGENVFLAGTYKAILDGVFKPLVTKVDLQVNTTVRSIIAAMNPHGPPLVTLTTADGTNHTFDEVVVTAPLGWLKKNIGAFSPPLPHRLTTAIANISYGRLEKVYFTFPTAWWLTPNAPKPFFTQFLSPKYSTETNPNKWSIECSSLASLPEPTSYPTLLFYINGPCAQHVTSLARHLTAGTAEHMNQLITFFHPYFSRLPHYSPTHPDCRPRAVLATDWIGDDLAGNGSYSTFQTSSSSSAFDADGNADDVQLDKDIEALREGVPERGLWFAGEATAPFVALGTVTGAYWSGEKVALRLLSVYGLGGEEDEKVEGEKMGLEEGLNVAGPKEMMSMVNGNGAAAV